jgi:hypothetical protein
MLVVRLDVRCGSMLVVRLDVSCGSMLVVRLDVSCGSMLVVIDENIVDSVFERVSAPDVVPELQGSLNYKQNITNKK